MSTPFSYGQLIPSVTRNFGSGPAEELTAHEYKTLWYAAVADIETMQQRVEKDEALLRQALEALEVYAEYDPEGGGVADKVAAALRERLAETANDLTRCPNCGGPADNGHDREVPPNPYWCSKCMESNARVD